MDRLVDLEGLCCPLCGTSLVQNLKVGRYYDLLTDDRLISHMVCAEFVGGMRLLHRITHVRTDAPEVRQRYLY